MRLSHCIESQQFSRELLFDLFRTADQLREQKTTDCLKGMVMASLFYEPSTRTRLSFESAMLRLGGSVVGTENAREFSSAVKGESLEDSTRVLCAYADVIVLRHNVEGAAKVCSSVSRIPVINAGDGKGQHPTQALLDVYTLYREFGKIDGLKIALVGDLASGRTVRSLCYLLGKFEGVEIIFVSPENLKMKEDIKDYLTRHAISFREESDLNAVLTEVDVVYMTRIQKERISSEDYDSARGKFILNEDNFHFLPRDARVMHPLPHVEEINLPVALETSDERVAYFRQAENGLYARMALLVHLLTEK